MTLSALAAAILLAQSPAPPATAPPDRASSTGAADAPATAAPQPDGASAAQPQPGQRAAPPAPEGPAGAPATAGARAAAKDGSARNAADSQARDDDRARDEQARAEAQAQAQRENAARIQSLQGEVDALRGDVYAAQAALADERARSDALEDQVAAQVEAQAAAARSPVERQAALGGALSGLNAALGSLSVGNAEGVDAALAGTEGALAQARAQAGQFGATQEATNASAGEQYISAAREALSRSDLYQARWYLGRAAAVALQAHTLAGEAAGAGASPVPAAPAAQTGTASGY